jgi:hypothetical protein
VRSNSEKESEKRRLKLRGAERKIRVEGGNPLTITCCKCSKEKSEADFYYGSRSKCKTCAKESSVSWGKKHPEKANAKARRWAKENPEKIKEAQKEWAKKNKEHVRAYARKWASDNAERLKAEYRANHPKKERVLLTKEEKAHKARKYYKENRVDLLKKCALWREANREFLREKSKREYHADPSKSMERRRKSRRLFPEKEKAFKDAARNNLTDSYVRGALKLPKGKCPTVLVELKRAQLQLNRAVQQQEQKK